MTLNLFTFNNYYNRIIKRHDTINEYAENGTLLHVFTSRNFNPNDGVSTTAIFNYKGTQPDYCVVTNDYNEIDSRWYVIEAVRTTGGQYQVTLYRDLVADYYNTAITSPCFIEKATLREDNPLIFNSENMTYNQIRTSQRLLSDKSGCPWIVGYISHNAILEPTAIEVSTIPTSATAGNLLKVQDITSWEYYNYTQHGTFSAGDVTSKALNLNARIVAHGTTGEIFNFDVPDEIRAGYVFLRSPGTDSKRFTDASAAANNALLSNMPVYGIWSTYRGDKTLISAETTARILGNQIAGISNYTNRLNEEAKVVLGNNNVSTGSTAISIKTLDGRLLLDEGSNKYYLINIIRDTVEYTQKPSSTDLFNAIAAATGNLTYEQFKKITGFSSDSIETWWAQLNSNNDLNIKVSVNTYKIKLTAVDTRVKTTLPRNTARPHLIDAPYDMFCLPYGDIECIGSTGTTFNNEKQVALSIAAAIPEKLGDGAVYDLQILPYCPVPYALTDDGKFDLRYGVHTEIYNTVDPDVGLRRGAIFWCTQSSFENTITDYKIDAATTAIDKKVNSETVLYRLCSPNGNGMFDLNAEMNNGVEYWEVYCTYKPFQPFIQVKPRFGGLYGIPTQYDCRGLICGGDFSLAQLSNTWATYQLQNKNYQEIFSRDIQNLQLNNNVAASKETLSMLKNRMNSAMSVINMASSGNLAGTVMSGVGYGVGAASDVINFAMDERLRNEAIDYKVDQFGYQLGNIQAIPSSISKTSANVITNPLIPYVEKYDCTETEKAALINKLKYNGMTVGVVGTIENYIQPELSYIKAKLIRAEGIADDYHIVNALAGELDKGVFL